MTTTASFLNVPYGGYLHNQVPAEDDELTHTGPGTPAGEWFRRFWQPVALSRKLKDLPVAIRILGEDLVAFRDRSGQVGLLELHCSHRGTSLEFGQIEERGIRCCYHAWLYDVDGKLLETPGEPPESTLKDRLYHGAYPTVEHQGLVFAYMGPPDKRPVFPNFDTYHMAAYQSEAHEPIAWPCNWLQVMENAEDPVHFQFLHSLPGNLGFSEEFSQAPEIDFIETPLGMMYIATRRVGDRVWVRMGDFILPNIQQGPSFDDSLDQRDGNRPTMTRWTVPIDDMNNLQFGFYRVREGEELKQDDGLGQTLDRPYEERQRLPGDYDAMNSQRPIAVHDLEHLAATDRGVIMLRGLVKRGVGEVRNGEDPHRVSLREGEIVPTYGHERVLDVPPAATREADRQVLRDTGRRAAEERIKELSKR